MFNTNISGRYYIQYLNPYSKLERFYIDDSGLDRCFYTNKKGEIESYDGKALSISDEYGGLGYYYCINKNRLIDIKYKNFNIINGLEDINDIIEIYYKDKIYYNIRVNVDNNTLDLYKNNTLYRSDLEKNEFKFNIRQKYEDPISLRGRNLFGKIKISDIDSNGNIVYYIDNEILLNNYKNINASIIYKGETLNKNLEIDNEVNFLNSNNVVIDNKDNIFYYYNVKKNNNKNSFLIKNFKNKRKINYINNDCSIISINNVDGEILIFSHDTKDNTININDVDGKRLYKLKVDKIYAEELIKYISIDSVYKNNSKELIININVKDYLKEKNRNIYFKNDMKIYEYKINELSKAKGTIIKNKKTGNCFIIGRELKELVSLKNKKFKNKLKI